MRLLEPFGSVHKYNRLHRSLILQNTRGHARFARSPLVIRLGDSRIRRGNSGYGLVLSSGWHYNYKIGTETLTEHYRTIFSLKIKFPFHFKIRRYIL